MHELTDRAAEEEFRVAVTKDVLADIIINFLGQRERLSFRKKAYFVLDLNDLRQFHLLLDAKVSKEVNMRLEFFQAAITYDDDTTRTLTSLESLDSYHETRISRRHHHPLRRRQPGHRHASLRHPVEVARRCARRCRP
jgi:hypothetical protein